MNSKDLFYEIIQLALDMNKKGRVIDIDLSGESVYIAMIGTIFIDDTDIQEKIDKLKEL